jgi:hypothetical protein
LKSEIGRGYCLRGGEVKRRLIFFDKSGRDARACFLKGRSTPMILWRPIFVIAGQKARKRRLDAKRSGNPCGIDESLWTTGSSPVVTN